MIYQLNTLIDLQLIFYIIIKNNIKYINIIMKKNIDEIKKNIEMLSFKDYKK